MNALGGRVAEIRLELPARGWLLDLADEGGDIVMGDAGADFDGHGQCRSYRRRVGPIICE